ncbi:MAG: hypothetical protein MHMPM18_003034 [Marteilia pararefringens]
MLINNSVANKIYGAKSFKTSLKATRSATKVTPTTCGTLPQRTERYNSKNLAEVQHFETFEVELNDEYGGFGQESTIYRRQPNETPEEARRCQTFDLDSFLDKSNNWKQTIEPPGSGAEHCTFNSLQPMSARATRRTRGKVEPMEQEAVAAAKNQEILWQEASIAKFGTKRGREAERNYEQVISGIPENSFNSLSNNPYKEKAKRQIKGHDFFTLINHEE